MALLEEPGIGACSGREFLWETEKKNSEKHVLSHIGTENQCHWTNLDSVNTEDKHILSNPENDNDWADIKTITTSTNFGRNTNINIIQKTNSSLWYCLN